MGSPGACPIDPAIRSYRPDEGHAQLARLSFLSVSDYPNPLPTRSAFAKVVSVRESL